MPTRQSNVGMRNCRKADKVSGGFLAGPNWDKAVAMLCAGSQAPAWEPANSEQ
jgi:hypothetical protein